MVDSPDDRQPLTDEPQQVVPATKVRPGGVGRTVFYMLLGSMGLLAIAWLALEIWAYSGDPMP